MIAAIEDITVNEGIDPRDSYVVSGGGATACHIGEMARHPGHQALHGAEIRRRPQRLWRADLRRALGGIGDPAHDRPRFRCSPRSNQLLAELRKRGRRLPDAGAAFAPDKQRFEFAFQGRYLYQSWDIEVPFEFPGDEFAAGDLAKLVAAFHQMHERIYTIKDENDVVEFTTWKVRAIGDTGGAGRRGHAATRATAAPAPKSRRPVYLGTALGMTEIPVHDGQATGPGTTISGPALIEEPTTTFLLLPGQVARVDGYGNYIVEIGG